MFQSELDIERIKTALTSGNTRVTARAISFIENEVPGYQSFLASLPPNSSARIIGITGPPGAGKSTLTDAITEVLLKENRKVAILCIDPSSPFTKGAVLGDRIRMGRWHNEPRVYIRSLATRGWMGGLHPKVLEITDLLKFAGFTDIIVETVGVGQSEVDIAGLADVTLVVLVPEAGDDIQTMKAGLMEIADVFVLNKSDRPGADQFIRHLKQQLSPSGMEHEKPIVKTTASKQEGVDNLVGVFTEFLKKENTPAARATLLTERAWQLIQQKRMRDLNKEILHQEIAAALEAGDFNLYQFAEKYADRP